MNLHGYGEGALRDVRYRIGLSVRKKCKFVNDIYNVVERGVIRKRERCGRIEGSSRGVGLGEPRELACVCCGQKRKRGVGGER